MSECTHQSPEHQQQMTKLRHRYVKGTATQEEIEEFWIEALKDPEQLELLKTEVNLKAVVKKRS